MLCLTMQRGDYFTIGGDVVVQCEQLNAKRVHLIVHAPRQVPILRGEVLERGGGQRPECVIQRPPRNVTSLPWTREKGAALTELRQVLEELEDGERARNLLNRIFPPK